MSRKSIRTTRAVEGSHGWTLYKAVATFYCRESWTSKGGAIMLSVAGVMQSIAEEKRREV